MSSYRAYKTYAYDESYQDVPLARVPESPSFQQQSLRVNLKKRAVRHQRLVYSLIVLAIVFGLFQTSRTIFFGVCKLTTLVGNQSIVEKYYDKTLQENRILHNYISVYSSPEGIEELARNKLEWVGQDEILVRTR